MARLNNPKDKKILAAFLALIFLNISVGLTGTFQIQSLNRKIQELGSRNLKLEKSVLEMRMNNAIYAMGVRNYVFWRVSKYLGAAPIAVDLDSVFQATERFNKQLAVYEQYAYLPIQKKWAAQIDVSFKDFCDLGRQLIGLIDGPKPVKLEGAINNLLMAFETRLYRLDEFLDDTMSKANLSDIEAQLIDTEAQKKKAVFSLALALISAVLISGLIAFSVYSRQKQERRYRQEIFNHMINLEENEHKYLSAQIHDQMGQDLSALKISLGIIEQGLSGLTEDLRFKFERSKKLVTQLIEKSHNIAFILRPPALDEVGLSESLQALLLDYKHLAGINYIYKGPEVEFSLPAEHTLLIYRIAQELLTNMLKHAQAKNVEIKLSRGKDWVELFYSDDGIGFNYAELINRPLRRKEDKLRLGLLGLKERVELMDGAISIESSANKGTRVTVRLTA